MCACVCEIIQNVDVLEACMCVHPCRCVVMVGLPYPNIKSPELNEKINYLNSTMVGIIIYS